MGIKTAIKRKLCEASISAVSEVVYHYIRNNQGTRLCEISKALMPHGETSRLFTSHLVKELTNKGRIVRHEYVSTKGRKTITYWA